MVYFTADWCTTCRHIERAILPRADLHAEAAGYDLIKVDLTRLDDARRAMMAELDVIGPPTLIWFDPEGAERPGARLVGEIEADAMIARFAQGQPR